jgi:hypothetical protein
MIFNLSQVWIRGIVSLAGATSGSFAANQLRRLLPHV